MLIHSSASGPDIGILAHLVIDVFVEMKFELSLKAFFGSEEFYTSYMAFVKCLI